MHEFKDLERINLKNLIDNALIGVVIHALDSSIVYANPTALKLLRLSFEQIIGKDAMDPQWNFLDEYGRKLSVDEYPVNKVLKWNAALHQEIIGVVDSERDISWFMVDAYAEQEEDSEMGFIVVTFIDITDKKTQFSFRDIVGNARDAIIVTEANAIDAPLGPKIIYVNEAFEQLTGYTADEVIGETPRILQGKHTDKSALERIRNALEKNQPVRETILNYSKSGHPYWLDIDIIPLANKMGEVTHFAAIERDVTEITYHSEQLEKKNHDLKVLKSNLQEIISKQTAELKEANLKLEQMAYFDSLTDLPNRRNFRDQFKRIASHADRNHSKIAYGLLDIDDFKKVNDTYGHETGDKVLVAVAQTFYNVFRRQDAFARLGGEEFAFAFEYQDESSIKTICQRLLEEVSQCKIPTENGETISVTASIGVSFCNGNDSEQVDQLYQCADAALYSAKRGGKNQFQLQQKSDDKKQ